MKSINLLAALLLFCASAHAQTYTCPAGDKVIYSDRPCGKVWNGELRQAEIFKCTVNGLVTYGDAPCKTGTGGEVKIEYDKPTPEQINQYRSDLKRRSDDADARTRFALEQSAAWDRNARENAAANARKQRADAQLKRLDDIQKKLDAIEIQGRHHRDPKNRYVSRYDH